MATNKSTTKRKRKYSQDFSGNSMTDQSFAAACDVNNIVRHYEATGLDPYVDRKKQERFSEASTIPYEQAMRAKAEIDSAFALLPLPERLRFDNDPQLWFDEVNEPEPLPEALKASETPPEDPAPQDTSEGE